MKRFNLGISVAAILLLSVCPALADLVVSAGTWDLQPNMAGQEITIAISGTGDVTNAVVAEEIVGDSPLPIFTGGDIITGTIFALNNTGSPIYDFAGQLAYLDVATNSGTVSINGSATLAKIIVSTVGVTSGSFELKLAGTQWGDTAVGTQPNVNVTYNPGSIHIVPEVIPEPSTLVLLCSLLAVLPAMGLWRRKGCKA